MNSSVLIINQCPIQRKKITSFVKNGFSFLSVSVVGSVLEGLKVIASEKIDIIILSTGNDGDNLSIFEHVTTSNFKWLVTLSGLDYIEEIIDVLPNGVLMEPVDYIQFKTMLNRAVKDTMIADLDDSLIRIPKSKGHFVFRSSDIIRAESDSNYTKLFLKGRRQPVMISRTLKYVEENYLTSNDFIRPHKSHLVNLNWVVSKLVSKLTIQLYDGTHIPVSRLKREEIQIAIMNIK